MAYLGLQDLVSVYGRRPSPARPCLDLYICNGACDANIACERLNLYRDRQPEEVHIADHRTNTRGGHCHVPRIGRGVCRGLHHRAGDGAHP